MSKPQQIQTVSCRDNENSNVKISQTGLDVASQRGLQR